MGTKGHGHQATLTRRIEDALQPFVSSGAMAGAVALAAGKVDVLGFATVGYADVAAGKPMERDTLFWIASQTKPITATALMMLVDDAKLSLDDSVEKYLPFFHDLWVVDEEKEDRKVLRRPKRPVTVRDLLSHTSGLPFRSALEEPTLDRLTLSDAARSYAMTPLQSQPGSRYAYSNAGINTAGHLLEVVSGMSYEAFLQNRLFQPLGMTDTTFRPTAAQQSRLAKAYQPNSEGSALEVIQISQLHYPLDDPNRQPMPAGGLFSTAPDVTRFCQMILNGGQAGGKTYLSAAALAEMTKKQTGPQIEESYGLGWSVGPDSYGHGGAYATNMTVHTNLGRITVFLVQHAGFLGDGGSSYPAFLQAALQSDTRPAG